MNKTLNVKSNKSKGENNKLKKKKLIENFLCYPSTKIKS